MRFRQNMIEYENRRILDTIHKAARITIDNENRRLAKERHEKYLKDLEEIANSAAIVKE